MSNPEKAPLSALLVLAGNPFLLLLVTLAILVGALGIMSDQLVFLMGNYQMNFIPAEIRMETDLTILIAAFGVFLEHRCWILDKIHPEGIPDAVARFDGYCHDTGVILILTAIVMEAADLLFLAMNGWGLTMTWLKFAEISLLFAINILAVAIVTGFALRLLGLIRSVHKVSG